MKVYLKNKSSEVDAVGDFCPSDNSLTVLAGSKISSSISAAPSFRGKKTIIKDREKYTDGTTVKMDAPFKSPSTAGNFVTGTSTNGLLCWKDESGRSIREILKEAK